ncbi:MAG TPA: signal peptidase I [Lachnospiraceae bacterium]|nr:signal peptidase I [Lachnospiraceae bacterium]
MVYGERRAVRRIGDAVLSALLFFNVAAILAFLISPYKLLVVRSDSMEPAIPVGSVLLVERVRDGDVLSVGDVVTYKRPGVPFTITHRIVEVTERGFIMKGDNLIEPDGEILREWVRYRVIGCFLMEQEWGEGG